MSASISDVESDDWNVISGEWRSYVKGEGDDISDSDNKEAIIDASKLDGETVEDKDESEKGREEESSSPPNQEDDDDKGSFDLRVSLSKLVQIFSETPFTLTSLIRGIASILFLYYIYSLTLDSYYKYKINNMIGTIDELPSNAKYIELHMKKCNSLYSYYQDVLDTCVDSNTDDDSCLGSYIKLVQKNAKFCSWDPEKIYKQQQVHVIYRHGREILGRLTDTSIKLVNSVGDNVLEKSSKQWESLKGVSGKVIPFYKRQLSELSKKEKEFSSFLAKKNKDLEVKQKWNDFVSGSGQLFRSSYDSLKKKSPLVWKSAKDKTQSGVSFVGKFINKENSKKVYDGVSDACGHAYKNLLAFISRF